MSHKLYAIEGLDETGKSTQVALLAQHYMCKKFHSPCEPIRSLALDRSIKPKARGLLMMASREQQLDKIILACKNDGIAIIDRFLLSTWAYQLGELSSELISYAELDILSQLNEHCISLETFLFQPSDFDQWWAHKQKFANTDAFSIADKASYLERHARYGKFAETSLWPVHLIDPLAQTIQETTEMLKELIAI